MKDLLPERVTIYLLSLTICFVWYNHGTPCNCFWVFLWYLLCSEMSWYHGLCVYQCVNGLDFLQTFCFNFCLIISVSSYNEKLHIVLVIYFVYEVLMVYTVFYDLLVSWKQHGLLGPSHCKQLNLSGQLLSILHISGFSPTLVHNNLYMPWYSVLWHVIF